MHDLSTVADSRKESFRVRKLDNGGYVLSYEIKKPNTKKDEYPYEDKEYGYDDLKSLLTGIEHIFGGKESKSEDDELTD